MKGAAQLYKEWMTDLLMQRELAGGQLVQHEEGRFVAALDRYWHLMTDDEQAEVEALFALGRRLETQDEPALIDRQVATGDHFLPRRAA